MKSKQELMQMEWDELTDYLNTLTASEWSVIVADAKNNGYDISEVLDFVKNEGSRFRVHWHGPLYDNVMDYFGITFFTVADGIGADEYPEELSNATSEEILEYRKRHSHLTL